MNFPVTVKTVFLKFPASDGAKERYENELSQILSKAHMIIGMTTCSTGQHDGIITTVAFMDEDPEEVVRRRAALANPGPMPPQYELRGVA